MRFKDKVVWKKAKHINKDSSYGMAAINFAERWAELMELDMLRDGKELRNCAKQRSHDADEEGITGYMYGIAVQLLAETWIYGEELMQWHNATTAPNAEAAAEANKLGVAINPAIVTMGHGCLTASPSISEISGDEALDRALGGKNG